MCSQPWRHIRIGKSGPDSLKIRWIKKNALWDDVQRARQAALDVVGLISLEMIISSHYLQMLMFKKEELDVEQGNTSAYTNTPTYSIKAIAASARHFLDRTTTQTSLLTQHADAALPCSPPYTGASKHNAVLNGLWFELDSYLHEPRAEPFKSHSRFGILSHQLVQSSLVLYSMYAPSL